MAKNKSGNPEVLSAIVRGNVVGVGNIFELSTKNVRPHNPEQVIHAHVTESFY